VERLRAPIDIKSAGSQIIVTVELQLGVRAASTAS
jgi:hypothetical protein